LRWLLILGWLFLSSTATTAQMVRSDAIGNDLTKERLCASRTPGKTVPFEIDSRYVARQHSEHADATFIAIDGMSPQLVECYLREGTGRYEPAIYSREQNYWHLIKPKQFETGIGTPKGTSMAANVCTEAARTKIEHPNFDHSVYSAVVEINIGSPMYHPGAQIAGAHAERYDIAVEGKSFYSSPGPDLAVIKFTCLLSPTLTLKAIKFK